MIQTLLLILPFGLTGALSPIMLTEQTMMLATSGGLQAGRRYAAGAALVLLAFVAVLVLFGSVISLPQEPKLDANLDIAIGLALVALSLFLRKPRIHRHRKKQHESHLGGSTAFGFGAISMATNFTTLALMIPPSKIIAASDLEFPAREILVLVLVVMASTPAWLPLALPAVAPGPAERGLRAFGGLIEERGRLLTVVLLGALGLLLILRGIVNGG